MSIGKKIKNLRKAQNLSQEKFAEHFNVTPQAVSKWENGTAYPDITIIPSLAVFFNISIDELFDFDKTKIESEIMAVIDEAYKYRYDNPNKSAAILKAGLEKYPNNEVLLNNLLYVSDNLDEIIDTAQTLLNNTSDDEIKYDVFRILAQTYLKTGNKEMCKSYISKIPELYFTKLELSAKYLHDIEAAKKQFVISVTQALDMLSCLGDDYSSLKKNIHDLVQQSGMLNY